MGPFRQRNFVSMSRKDVNATAVRTDPSSRVRPHCACDLARDKLESPIQFDTNRSGLNPYENVISKRSASRLQLAWSKDAVGAFLASVEVAEGVVYAASQGGILYALNALSGNVVVGICREKPDQWKDSGGGKWCCISCHRGSRIQQREQVAVKP
jgi:outer membrane protein assembly factor BamB